MRGAYNSESVQKGTGLFHQIITLITAITIVINPPSSSTTQKVVVYVDVITTHLSFTAGNYYHTIHI